MAFELNIDNNLPPILNGTKGERDFRYNYMKPIVRLLKEHSLYAHLHQNQELESATLVSIPAPPPPIEIESHNSQNIINEKNDSPLLGQASQNDGIESNQFLDYLYSNYLNLQNLASSYLSIYNYLNPQTSQSNEVNLLFQIKYSI